MKKKVFEEFLEKVKQAKSPEEVEAAAKECGLELTEEKLAKLEKALREKKGELTDEELAGVAGGIDWGYIDEQIKKYGPDIVYTLAPFLT